MADYRRRVTREAMSVRLDTNGMMADAIAVGGITPADVASIERCISEVTHALKGRRSAHEIAPFDLPYEKRSIQHIKALAESVREECDTLVVLAIGGSALATRCMVETLGPGTRRILVADNVDPWSFGALLDSLDLTRTTFNVISKSGETAETMAQFLIVRDLLLRSLGAVDYTQRVIITTDELDGALRQVVHDEGFRALTIPARVAGRFSVLSSVGLFPAAVAGLNLDDLIAGAAWMDSRCQDANVWKNPAHLLGTLLYLSDTHYGRHNAVFMPYSDRLKCFAAWFCHLWAGSLGKGQTIDGQPTQIGQTPLAAIGATDQHSLLQLLIDGPQDKVVIMVRVEDHGRELPIASAYADLDAIGYLGGAGLGQLLNHEQRGTEFGLLKAGRPTMTLTVPQLNAFTLGQLFYLFEVAAVFAAGLYRVDPFNQPGLEESKRLTYGQMGRKGFEAKQAEVEELLARKRPEYIL